MALSGLLVKQVDVTDVEKRRVPSKHYVFVIEVTWSDGSRHVIYRRYSKFFSLQTELIERYPVEGGVKDPSCRILPFLPGKIIFGRSHIREVALKRKDHINEYCQTLIQLPAYISGCEEVIHFFQSSAEDTEDLKGAVSHASGAVLKIADSISEPVQLEQYVVLADYKKNRKSEVSVADGDIVDVIEKHENGWWLVSFEDEQGWVPSSYLRSVHSGYEEPVPRQCTGNEAVDYICVQRFSAKEEDELSIEVGAVVEVSKKNTDGWWLLKSNGKMGWAPRANLKRIPPNLVKARNKGHQEIKVADVRRGTCVKGHRMEPPPRHKSVKKIMKNGVSGPIAAQKSSPSDMEYFTSAEIKAQLGKGTVTFEEGTSLQVIEKAPNGWWFVKVGAQEGWVPASDVQRRRKSQAGIYEDVYENVANISLNSICEDSNPESHDYTYIDDFCDVASTEVIHCITLGAYVASDDNDVSFEEGEKAEVLDRDSSGWWYVRIGDREGWAPCTFLERLTFPLKIKSAPFNKRSSSKINIAVPPAKPSRSRVPVKYENVAIKTESKRGLDDRARLTGKKLPIPGRPPAPATKESIPIRKEELAGQGKGVEPPLKRPESNQQLPRKVSNPLALDEILRTKGLKSEAGGSFPTGTVTASSKSIVEPQKKPLVDIAVSGITSELDAVMKARRKATEQTSNIETVDYNKGMTKVSPTVRPRPKPRTRPQSHHHEDGDTSLKKAESSFLEQRARSSSCLTSSALRSAPVVEVDEMQGVRRSSPVRPSSPVLRKKRPERPPPPKSVGVKSMVDEVYIAISTFSDSDAGMLNFREGDTIVIIEKTEGGWWFAKRGCEEGWVPSNFLSPEIVQKN